MTVREKPVRKTKRSKVRSKLVLGITTMATAVMVSLGMTTSVFGNAVAANEENVVEEATSQSTEVNDELLGDVNENGKIDIGDAVSIMGYIANRDRYPLSASALNKADVYARGDGVTCADALSIQKYMINVISCLPESYNNEPQVTTVTTVQNPEQMMSTTTTTNINTEVTLTDIPIIKDTNIHIGSNNESTTTQVAVSTTTSGSTSTSVSTSTSASTSTSTTRDTTSTTAKPIETTTSTTSTAKPTQTSTTTTSKPITSTTTTVVKEQWQEQLDSIEKAENDIKQALYNQLVKERDAVGVKTQYCSDVDVYSNYRAIQISSNFSHDLNEMGEAYKVSFGADSVNDDPDGYYINEAIAKGVYFEGSDPEEIARGLILSAKSSPTHWKYMTHKLSSYVSIGVHTSNGQIYVCVSMISERSPAFN